jgi:predicted HicB family RNase H-like nuclease
MNTIEKAVTLARKSDKKESDSMKTPKTKWKQLTIRIPEEVHRALKIRVAEEGGSMAEVIEKLVREYLVKGKRS